MTCVLAFGCAIFALFSNNLSNIPELFYKVKVHDFMAELNVQMVFSISAYRDPRYAD